MRCKRLLNRFTHIPGMCAPAKPCTDGCCSTHHVPEFVRARGISCARYSAWLSRQALTCKQRDPLERRQPIVAYRDAIHKAVLRSGGRDEYTGDPLEWNRLNHARPTTGGRRSHRIKGHYPSVDHYQGTGVLSYRICSGEVNFAKGALDHQQFVAMCRKVAAHHEGWGKA